MSWKPGQKAAFGREINAATIAQAQGDAQAEFAHLERAHVLGQRSTLAHTFAHWRMFRFGLRQRDRREVIGQLPRMLAALTKSKIWVPVGNTGGARVNPFRSMPVAGDLRIYFD
ncbi:MAG TPA: DUF3703 domain-containing protein [Dokdonella sp.]|uniref:DUF3703 domain-containing protein n=1 Tax=Dokdonella sp. TaxID=2291710 RepID=UPI002D80E0C1|nr:DUF3703 domain-containing protein [Dokdonella sp.]HET9033079.1 DUF3703 domain-containing protein [Dokdonella sp.]